MLISEGVTGRGRKLRQITPASICIILYSYFKNMLTSIKATVSSHLQFACFWTPIQDIKTSLVLQTFFK